MPEGFLNKATNAAIVTRECSHPVIARNEMTKQSIIYIKVRLLRFARNDGWDVYCPSSFFNLA